ncbi:MAG TPA: amidohydrolase family protein [Lacipirellulaceae bacterium]|nr:amidohydrolase family protein [Lacipirellulaceae bacterium]HMP05220.1 amidohydrolase family protein [Lacipirellulaceae bacterium]
MVIDAHMHVWNIIDGCICNEMPVRPLTHGKIQVGDRRLQGMPALLLDCAARFECAIAEFDAAGVDAGVVVQDYMDGEQNEYLLREGRHWADRFFLHGLPNFWNTDCVLLESQNLFAQGFRGLKLPAAHLASKVAIDDKRLMPLWELMEREGYVLSVDLAADEQQSRELENILSAYPKLKVAIGHFGLPNRGGWPHQLNLGRHEHVYLEMGGIIWLYRHEGFPFPGALQTIARAKDAIGCHKLMWGSDFPRTMVDFTYRQSLDFVRDCDCFSDDEKRLLLGGNARRLYAIDAPDSERTPWELITAL